MDIHLTLNEEINWVIRRKADDCNCNPCICTNDMKERYFNEIKLSLKKHNREYLDHHPGTIALCNRSSKKTINSN